MKTKNYKKHYSKEEINKRIEAKKKLGKDIVETLQYGEAEKKRIDMIRKRSSYKFFGDMWNDFPKKFSKHDRALMLIFVWKGIESYRGFKYRKNSIWALESIAVVIKDKGLSDFKSKQEINL